MPHPDAHDAPPPFSATPRDADLPARVIAVLGMHRSGTSCVTGTLQDYGLFLGEHSTWNRHNTKGNRENQSIVDLNDKVLASNGGDWLQPPKSIVWSDAHLAEAREILAGYSEQALFGFKDPRTLITLDGWRSILGDRLSYVGIFRNPNSVVRSIQSRGEVRRETALNAWQTYNQRLIDVRRADRFPVLCFDWPEQKLQRKLAKTASKLGLGQPTTDRFFNAELKHYDVADGAIPERAEKILKELHALTRFPRQWL